MEPFVDAQVYIAGLRHISSGIGAKQVDALNTVLLRQWSHDVFQFLDRISIDHGSHLPLVLNEIVSSPVYQDDPEKTTGSYRSNPYRRTTLSSFSKNGPLPSQRKRKLAAACTQSIGNPVA